MEQRSPELSFLLRHPYYAWAALSNFAALNKTQMHRYAAKLYWMNVTCNRKIHIDQHFIQEHFPYIPFANRCTTGEAFEFNERLIWSVELLKRYYRHWSWECLAQNENVLRDPLIMAEFMNELSPHYLIQYDEEELSLDPFMRKHEESMRVRTWELENTLTWEEFYAKSKKPWDIISSSEKLPWTIERIEHHKFELSWDILSCNNSLPWNERLIRQFEDRWYWGSKEGDGLGLQFNFIIPWNASLLRDYRARLLSYPLSYNTEIEWNIDMLLEFEDWWDYDSLDSNSALWEKVFEGKIGDVEELMLKLG